jgi:anaerobic selenocysteine-containing dehydrogenase
MIAGTNRDRVGHADFGEKFVPHFWKDVIELFYVRKPRPAQITLRDFFEKVDNMMYGYGRAPQVDGSGTVTYRLVDPQQGVPRYVPLARDSRHPLVLISPASPKMINSMFGEFQQPSPAIQLTPADAAARGLRDGQQVRVHSALGDIVVPLEVSADLRDGVAHMTKGVWLRAHDGGRGVNALTPATGDPLGNGACFNDAMVEVEPA